MRFQKSLVMMTCCNNSVYTLLISMFSYVYDPTCSVTEENIILYVISKTHSRMGTLKFEKIFSPGKGQCENYYSGSVLNVRFYFKSPKVHLQCYIFLWKPPYFEDIWQ